MDAVPSTYLGQPIYGMKRDMRPIANAVLDAFAQASEDSGLQVSKSSTESPISRHIHQDWSGLYGLQRRWRPVFESTHR